MNKMKHKNKALIAVCLFALVCLGSSLCGAVEPSEQDMQLAEEKMLRLREVYKQVQQAELELQRLSEEAEREEPLLRPTVEALKKMNAFLEAQDHRRFQAYLDNSKDRKAAYRLYEHCKVIFSRSKYFELLNDPNEERLVKKPLIHLYQKELPEELRETLDPNDPNDPNEERVWQSIKQLYFQQPSEEYLQQRRDYYIKEKGVPEWLPDYGGDMAFADGMISTYEAGLFLLTPQNVRDAEKRVNNLYGEIGKIYFRWSKMRHLLVGENNPDNEAVIHAVQEHMQLWPTVFIK
jgi:hypothetical protein